MKRILAVVVLGVLASGAWAQTDDDTLRSAAGADDNVALIRQLLADGANPNAKDRQGRTALHIAAYRRARQNMAVLLANGGYPDVQDRDGDTPLHLAADQSSPIGSASDATAILLATARSERIARHCQPGGRYAASRGRPD